MAALKARPLVWVQRRFCKKMTPKEDMIDGLWDKDEDYSFARLPVDTKNIEKVFISKLFSCAKRPNILFPIDSRQLKVLSEPLEFYQCLMVSRHIVSTLHNKMVFFRQDMIRQSKKRIVISALYLGTGKLERQLVQCIAEQALKYPDLKIKFLFDYNRGNRPDFSQENPLEFDASTRQIVEPLAARADVAFFLSPVYSNPFYKQFILGSSPLNELVSLQHIKCYIFDDNIICSGANLSHTYFTNRQDRYICLKSSELCNYLSEALQLLIDRSFLLDEKGNLSLNPKSIHHPLDWASQKKIKKSFTYALNEIQKKYEKPFEVLTKHDSFISPYFQMRCLGVEEDYRLTQTLFTTVQGLPNPCLSSGYFNPHIDHALQLINHTGTHALEILAPSCSTNGFAGSRGFKKYIPYAYNYRMLNFVRYLGSLGTHLRVKLYERPGWTYHAKGFWCDIDRDTFITIFGSSNFGYRSVERDLELQFLLVTRKRFVKHFFHQEREKIWKFAVDTDDIKLELKDIPIFAKIVGTLGKHLL